MQFREPNKHHGETGTESPYESRSAGKHLKAVSDDGTNDYGFSAFMGGCGDPDFGGIYDGGDWWSASEGAGGYAYHLRMYVGDGSVNWSRGIDKSFFLSVRCIQD